MAPGRLAAVLFGQVFIDQVTSARVESFMTVGMVSGRGNGRDQSRRDTALILYNSTKGLTGKVCIYGRESSPARNPLAE